MEACEERSILILHFAFSILCEQVLCSTNTMINICIKPALCTTYYRAYMLMNVHSFGLISINYDLSKSVSKTVLEVYN